MREENGMKVIIEGEAKEIAALVLAVQGRSEDKQTENMNEQEALIREYERRLAKLKNGVSPADVIF